MSISFLFTGESEWCIMFYRFLDCMAGSEGIGLRQIEEEIFQEVIKSEVEEELGAWQGNGNQNVLADVKIAKAIRSAFYNYEKSVDVNIDESFFKF